MRSLVVALAGAMLVACGPPDEIVVIDPPPAKVKEAPPAPDPGRDLPTAQQDPKNENDKNAPVPAPVAAR